ncbi:hypothetical protein VTL71DRAFT_15858 [Oculimacula yallundae]|uniref:Rhodopsin domain-containing protein n=1 Tax=Oculimacula yallundae TaxID=86028 RepID=A0ABR4CCT9_9HELO
MTSIFRECRPLELCWQVLPDTPACVKAVVEIVVMESLNISTNVFIMAIPIPLLLRKRKRLSTRHKIAVSVMFLGVASLAVISLLRILIILEELTTQNKGMWAQIECFLATAVANAPVLQEMWRHGWGHLRCRRFSKDYCSSGNVLATRATDRSSGEEQRPSDVSTHAGIPSQDRSSDSEADHDIASRQGTASSKGSRIKIGLRRSMRKAGQKLRSSLEMLEIEKSVALIQHTKTGKLTPPPATPGPVDGEFFSVPSHGHERTARIRTEVSCNKGLLGGKNAKVQRSWMAIVFRGPEGCG